MIPTTQETDDELDVTEPLMCNGSTKRGADGRTYSEHSRSPSYSRIELGLRTKYCAFWSGRTGGAMVEIYSLSRFVA